MSALEFFQNFQRKKSRPIFDKKVELRLMTHSRKYSSANIFGILSGRPTTKTIKFSYFNKMCVRQNDRGRPKDSLDF